MTSPNSQARLSTVISLRSLAGLYAANFFLTEMVGVVAPFLDVFLQKQGWTYDRIGIAASISGLGTMLFLIPAGVIADEWPRRRLLLGIACIVFGICYVAIPRLANSPISVEGLLLLSGGAYAFFVPVVAALGLSLSGNRGFSRIMGASQGWSHAGNIVAAGTALITVRWLGVASVFDTVALVCLFSTVSLMLIRSRELKPIEGAERRRGRSRLADIAALFRDRRVVILIASVAFFQIANAPAMPLAALYMQHLEGNENHVAWIVFAAQTVMVPVSVIGALCCERFGRKPVFTVAFIVLPIRLALFALSTHPGQIIAVQALDGFCAGIYDVIICIVCADLTRGKPGFNTLVGVMQTTVAFGSFVGPLAQGYVTEHLGFPATFFCLAAIAVIGAVLFIRFMPETQAKENNVVPTS